MILNRSDERGHPYLVPEYLVPDTKYDVSCGCLADILYQVQEVPLYS